jgi:nitrogen regulatory protein PII
MEFINRIEIIVSSLEQKEVIDILNSVKVNGYTLIENSAGKGDRGTCYNDLDREFSNSYISTICTNTIQIEYLVRDILPILKNIGGICLITACNSLVSDNFSPSLTSLNSSIPIMQEVQKVEIVIDTSHLEDAINILESVSVSGYTIIKDTSGKGERGLASSDIDYRFTNSYIMTVCTNQKQLDNLVEKITPVLKKIGGVCLVTNAKWVNH